MCNHNHSDESQHSTTRIQSRLHFETTCEYCGCNNCGEPILLHACSRCKATLCFCHLLIENHDCIPTERGWSEYVKWQEKIR